MANIWGNNGNSERLFSWAPKSLQMVTVVMKLKDTPCKKSYDQPTQHIKKQRHYFANKGPSSQSCGFPVVMYGCERTIKKAEHQRIDAFELWCWRSPFRVSWTARRSNPSILKEISPEYSLKGLMLKNWLWPSGAKNWLIWKDPDAVNDWRWEKGTTEDQMVGCHHQLPEFTQTHVHWVGDG